MLSTTPFKVAAIQAAPHYLDVEASLDKACRLISEAGETGAVVCGFSETWLPGHPFFCFSGMSNLWWEAAAEYLEQSITIPGPETDRLCAAAAAAHIDVVMGVVERDPITEGSVYCTILFISSDGRLLGRHRKTRPTMHERVLWSDGDADGLVVYQRPYGRLSALSCWEHNSVLPGYALMEQGTQVHFALWPGMDVEAPPPPNALFSRMSVLTRAFASQAGSFVVSVGGLRSKDAVPERYQSLMPFDLSGDSIIIDPRSEVLAGPAKDETILVTECDPKRLHYAKVASDVAGHYNRKDLFSFKVNRNPQPDLNSEPVDMSVSEAPETNRQG